MANAKSTRIVDISGHQFGRLTALAISSPSRRQEPMWHCRCICGGEVVVLRRSLRSGNTRSCGCLTKEHARQLVLANHKHGLMGTPTYHSWSDMLKRVRNPQQKNFSDYGGRGIGVCERWLTFTNFLADMGEKPSRKHSIDRIDNDGDYSPDNCRWATRIEQANNTRANVILSYQGESKTLAQWSRIVGIKYQTLQSRLVDLGWTVGRALGTPVRGRDK